MVFEEKYPEKINDNEIKNAIFFLLIYIEKSGNKKYRLQWPMILCLTV